MITALKDRFYDVVASVYLYNEHVGWKGLERLLEAVKEKLPEESELHQAMAKHLRDERKHYFLFKKHFQDEGRMPIKVGPMFGYVDQFIRRVFRKPLDLLDEGAILSDDRQFSKMCRLIMMTERRGLKQVGALLGNRLVRRHVGLMKIYKVIEEDEPSHFLPYQRWLKSRSSDQPGWRERIADLWIHYSLMLVKIPFLFLNVWMHRLSEFPS